MNIKLLTAIKNSGFKQWQICQQVQISEPRLSRIIAENSKPPTTEEKIRLANALGFHVDALFDNKGGV